MIRAPFRAATLAACAAVALAGAAAQTPSGPAADPSTLLERAALELAGGFRTLVAFDLPLVPGTPLDAPGPSTAAPAAPAGREPAGPAYDAAALARLAIARNPALGEALAGLAGAQSDLDSARASRFPKIEGSASGTYIGNPMEAMVIPAGAFGYTTAPAFTLIPSTDVTLLEAQEPTYYQFKATLTQPIFTWGRIDAGIDMALAGREAAAVSAAKARRATLVRLGATLDALSYLVRLDEVLGLQDSVGDRLVFVAEQSRRAGFITEGELIEARIDSKELDLARAELAARREGLLQDLRGLCGLPELRLEDLALTAPSAGSSRVQAEGLPAAARAGSLDLELVAALERARRAGERLAGASRSLLPSFALRAELGYAGSAFPLVEEGWDEADDWSLTLTVASTVTLFDGGAASAAARKAAAELDAARAQARAADAGVDAFVRSTTLDLELAKARLEYDVLKLEGHGERLSRLRNERLAGSGTETEYLRELIATLATVADGWTRLSEYRGSLWSLEAVLPAP